MKLKSALKYRYQKNLKLIGVFYLALSVIILVPFIAKKLFSYSIGTFEDGVDMFYYLTAVFSFAMGFLSFKEEQDFFVQNGAIRGQAYKSFIGYLPVTVVFALAERLFTFLLCKVIKADYSHFFSTKAAIENRTFIEDVLYETLALMCFLCLGYLIAIIIRRIKPIYIILATVLISVGLYADYLSSKTNRVLPIFAYVPSLIYFGSAFNELVPLNFVVSHVLTICILLSLSYILALGMSVNGKEKQKWIRKNILCHQLL